MSDKPDSAVLNFYETSTGQSLTFQECVADPQLNSEAVKITSGCAMFSLSFEHVAGGYEDCVDINGGCKVVSMHAEDWYVVGEYLATIKGQSEDIWLSSGPKGVHGAPKSGVHVDIGNYSTKGNRPTGTVYLNLETDDGSPIFVRVLNGREVVIQNPAQKYVIDRSKNGYFRYTYVPFRALQLFLLRLFKKA